MDLAFKVESSPLRIDLSGISHNVDDSKQHSARISSCSSSRSTEFQAVLDGFSTLKINEGKTQENETKKCFGENGDAGRLLNRRRNSTELTPGDLVMEFSQAPQRVRRKSLPSLGLVAVDIQCNVPTKMKNSHSFPNDVTRNIMGSELKSIQEIPEKGARKSSHIRGFTKVTSKPKGSFPGGRRFSLGAQLNMNHQSGTLGFRANQRRASCSKIVESPSEWRVKIHKRSLDIGNDDDRLYSHIQTRHASFAGFSSFTSQPQGSTDLFPRIGRRNSILGEGKKSRTRYNGI